MVRIVGILCGSAIAVSFLIIALGVPEFLPEALEIDAVEVAPEVVAAIERPSNPEPLAVIESEPEPQPALEISPVSVPLTEVPLTEVPLAEAPLAEHWYAFWSPFRSEFAANGFVSQLQKTTGMDYRVVRLKPGVYEVAFAYESASDIDGKLAAISAATGLEMPGG